MWPARSRTRAASPSVACQSWVRTASSGPAVAARRAPATACRAHRDVPDGVLALGLERLDQAGDLAPQPGELLDPLIGGALRMDATTVTPPRITADSVGSTTSSSRRERTRQFFSA